MNRTSLMGWLTGSAAVMLLTLAAVGSSAPAARANPLGDWIVGIIFPPVPAQCPGIITNGVYTGCVSPGRACTLNGTPSTCQNTIAGTNCTC